MFTATSEPPLMLSFSVVLALRRAITAARMDAGNMEWFKMGMQKMVDFSATDFLRPLIFNNLNV